MIDQGDYQIAWQAYLGCGLLAAVLWLFIVRRIPAAFLRYWLMLAGVIFLFTPVPHPLNPAIWVPGNVAAVLSLMTEGLESAMPIILTMAAGQVLALILAVSLLLWFGKGGSNDKPAESNKANAPKKNRRKAAVVRQEPSLKVETDKV
ncbi:hypothetical protein IMCC21906_02079 [Spongiibacter sp. IMCC21906]|uniref:hypothetical protein n=1 Tax=Spongiibacter sp. IMCC21906 TaxID=1620392 RepID=UPI00062DCC94|nr:hypothetical protein [Spongiibacter sp. IMCC21906]AKH69749.1 hypothetical protein IMCC21906_02079 [Spongiibacter sp. IMCC21906]